MKRESAEKQSKSKTAKKTPKKSPKTKAVQPRKLTLAEKQEIKL